MKLTKQPLSLKEKPDKLSFWEQPPPKKIMLAVNNRKCLLNPVLTFSLNFFRKKSVFINLFQNSVRL